MTKMAKKIRQKWNLSRAKKEFRQRNEEILDDSSKRPKTGFVFNLHRLVNDGFTIVSTPYRIKRILDELNCVVISSQRDLKKYADKLDVIFSAEPIWEAPLLDLSQYNTVPKLMFKSDPHKKPDYFYRYFSENRFDFMVVPYLNPTLYYFPQIRKDQLFYSPWAVPADFIRDLKVKRNNSDKLLLFGAYKHEIYKTRMWCKQFDFVEFKHFSGVENKKLWGAAYHNWLSSYDSVIAATSQDEKWRYTVAKYFEIPASGALLFAQETDDLGLCGFVDGKNCLVFNEENFEHKAREYLNNTDQYMSIREKGFALIKERHTVEKRVEELKQFILSKI